MTKYFLTALFLLTILSCNIKTESSHNDKAEITGNDKAQVSIKEKHLADSLRYVLKISDSIRVLINKTIKGVVGKKVSDDYDLNENGVYEKYIFYNILGEIVGQSFDRDEDGAIDSLILNLDDNGRNIYFC